MGTEKMMEFISDKNTQIYGKAYKSIFLKLKEMNFQDDFLSIYNDRESLRQIIIDLNPNTIRDITKILVAFNSYARYINNKDVQRTIESIERREIWGKIKHGKHKFISYRSYLEIIDDIDKYEELNSLYYQTLFMSVYEGMYSNNMGVLVELRASDIDENNNVVLHNEEGESYQIKISNKLAENLKELAAIYEEERKSRGCFKVKTKGKYPDSCFKIEQRGGEKENYKFSYYKKLRKIQKEYIGFKCLPENIFISGILHRLKEKFEEKNVTLKEVFDVKNSRYSYEVKDIIAQELREYNYDISVGAFRESVAGFMKDFNEDYE